MIGEADLKSYTLEDGREFLKFKNSYSRLPALLSLQLALEFADWAKLLGEEWPSCDNIGQFTDDLLDSPFGDALDDQQLWHQHFMTDDERAFFDALPDSFVVYRGCYASNKWGLSWSLDRAVAEQFPTLNRYRQAGQPLLVKALATKAQVIGVKLDRSEAEVIIERPKHISTSHVR